MPNSVYKIIEIVGSSPESWEKAAQNAIAQVSQTVEDLRIAEVTKMDMHLWEGKIQYYRVKMKISFKYKAHES